MGLFSTVLHVHKKEQAEVVNELIKELAEKRGISKCSRIDIDDINYEQVISEDQNTKGAILYLVTEKQGAWVSVIELNIDIEKPSYLYELTNSLSLRLDTYCLSFHLHDDDVLFYNLDEKGESLDGYNSNYQYFFVEPADRDEITSQRHTPNVFSGIIPATKNIKVLNDILNEGYWNAFDNNDLDEDGVPNGDKYDVDEEERFVRIGKYLEIYAKEDYPFANWHDNLSKLKPSHCYLLKAER